MIRFQKITLRNVQYINYEVTNLRVDFGLETPPYCTQSVDVCDRFSAPSGTRRVLRDPHDGVLTKLDDIQ